MDILNKIKTHSCTNKCKLYVVGGYVRDKILNLDHNRDIDLIFDGNINKLIGSLKNEGYGIFQIKKDIDIYRCIDDEKNEVDISYIKGNSIEEDLKNRDFTINAIAIDLINNIMVDPFKGYKDLKEGVIRKVKKDSIKDDVIRILRAIRFSIKYNFYMDVEIREDIKMYSIEILNSPKERLFNELMKVISEDDEGVAYSEFVKYNLLNILIYNSKDIYHKISPSKHIYIVYKLYKNIVNKNLSIKGFEKEKINETISGFAVLDYIALAIILNNLMHNLNNDIKSELVRKFCIENRFPKKASKIICSMIRGIKWPMIIFNDNRKENYYKFFKSYDDISNYILINSYCEVHYKNILGDINSEYLSTYKNFIEKSIEEKLRYDHIKNNKIINGNDIQSILNVKGKDIGNILEKINELRYYKKLNSREEILSFLKQGNFKL